MEIYELNRLYRETGTEFPIARIKADSYDEAIKVAEHIEVLPGIFGDDIVKPDQPMILLTRDYHAEDKHERKILGEVRYSERRNSDGSLNITDVEVK